MKGCEDPSGFSLLVWKASRNHLDVVESHPREPACPGEGHGEGEAPALEPRETSGPVGWKQSGVVRQQDPGEVQQVGPPALATLLLLSSGDRPCGSSDSAGVGRLIWPGWRSGLWDKWCQLSLTPCSPWGLMCHASADGPRLPPRPPAPVGLAVLSGATPSAGHSLPRLLFYPRSPTGHRSDGRVPAARPDVHCSLCPTQCSSHVPWRLLEPSLVFSLLFVLSFACAVL